jgi:hypothetical protein
MDPLRDKLSSQAQQKETLCDNAESGADNSMTLRKQARQSYRGDLGGSSWPSSIE